MRPKTNIGLGSVLGGGGRSSIRTVEGEIWIRHLGIGDLDYRVEPKGTDEIAEALHALEAVRQTCIRAMQLDRVQQLSDELQGKNEELEATLDELQRTQDRIVSQKKLAELGELSAGVAHEIRNPLQFIKNFAESSAGIVEELVGLLQQAGANPGPEDRQEMDELAGDLSVNMERIAHHSGRANRIVTDMIALHRNTPRDFRRVDVNRLVMEQAMVAYQAARTRNMSFDVDTRQDLDPGAGEVSAIAEDLGRVFVNLMNNAYQATADRAEQDPDYEPVVRIATARTGDRMEVRFRDNGVGMTPAVMARVFNPFFTTRSGNRSTGLGLSLSHDVVREHGGWISSESKLGEYTEMTVILPLYLGPERLQRLGQASGRAAASP